MKPLSSHSLFCSPPTSLSLRLGSVVALTLLPLSACDEDESFPVIVDAAPVDAAGPAPADAGPGPDGGSAPDVAAAQGGLGPDGRGADAGSAPDAAGTPDTAGKPDVPPPAPLFVVSATQFGPNSSTSVVQLISDPRADLTLPVSAGFEVGGTAALYGTERTGRVIVGSSDGPTLTEYVLAENGQLQAGRTMSLLNLGFSSGFRRDGLVPFISPDKAYILDDQNLQGVIWNPSQMTIQGTFSLQAAAEPGLSFELGERAVARDGLLFVGANQRRDDDGEAGKAMVLVINPATNTLQQVISDTRCGNTLHVVNQDGTLYVSSGTIAAIVELQGHQPGYPSPCLLRILPGQLAFDPTFYVKLSTVLGGNPGGRLVKSQNGKAFVTAMHVAELDPTLIGPMAEFWGPWDAPVWHWWEITLGATTPGVKLATAPPSSAGGRVIFSDGEEFIQHRNGPQTSLYTTDAAGNLNKGITVTGVPYGLVRIR